MWYSFLLSRWERKGEGKKEPLLLRRTGLSFFSASAAGSSDRKRWTEVGSRAAMLRSNEVKSEKRGSLLLGKAFKIDTDQEEGKWKSREGAKWPSFFLLPDNSFPITIASFYLTLHFFLFPGKARLYPNCSRDGSSIDQSCSTERQKTVCCDAWMGKKEEDKRGKKELSESPRDSSCQNNFLLLLSSSLHPTIVLPPSFALVWPTYISPLPLPPTKKEEEGD